MQDWSKNIVALTTIAALLLLLVGAMFSVSSVLSCSCSLSAMTLDLKSARSIFLAAVDETPRRTSMRYIDSACAGDESLRREVLRLLNAYGNLHSFMEHPAAGSAPTVDLRAAGADRHDDRPLQAAWSRSAKGAWASSTSPSRPSRSAAASRSRSSSRHGHAPGHRPLRGRAAGPGDDGPSQHRQSPRCGTTGSSRRARR